MPSPIYTIPPSVSFVDALAEGIYRQYGHDPLAFSDTLILLPNRRSCRVLRDAFLRMTSGKPLILPAIRPIGDTDESEWTLGESDGFLLPPAISHTKRRVLLAELVQRQRDDTAFKADPKRTINSDQAMRLAIALERFLDEVQRERLSFDALEDVVPEELAEHWQITLDFLSLLSREWPKILEQNGMIDPVERRNRLLDMQAAQWKKKPPQHPVIAAGTTGSMPAVRMLLRGILDMPHGTVILPGLDNWMDDNTWHAVDACHPQHGMKQLLEALKVLRTDVEPWPSTIDKEESDSATRGRGALLMEAFRPAATVNAWRHLALPVESVTGLTCIAADTLHEEAAIIAMILRHTLQTAEKRAALVTNERRLARQVISILKRWDISIDDSAGRPLIALPSVVFLRLIAQAVVQRFSPVSFLALLKHPFMRMELSAGECRRRSRLLERGILRGARIVGGLPAYREALLHSDALQAPDKTMLAEWVIVIEKCCMPFAQLLGKPHADCAEVVEAHIACAEALGGSKAQLWSGDEGKEIITVIDEIVEGSRQHVIEPWFYPDILKSLFAGRVSRPHYGTHPRLAILSPIEARLQRFDTVILGGMNEGSWPGHGFNPWMNRSMCHTFGLPTEEHHAGMAAHDFTQCCHTAELFITRSFKMDGVPTLPSPFLHRLDTVLKTAGLHSAAYNGQRWIQWARQMHDDGTPPESMAPPAPRPPISARPTALSVTAIEKLMRDPYSIYASHILKLKPLEEIDKNPDARHFGSLIHSALERFVRAWAELPENEQFQTLLAYGRDVFSNSPHGPAMQTLWWPRFERIAAWFVENERKRRTFLKTVRTEIKGQTEIMAGSRKFILKARADRIEEDKGGRLVIVDYKTGEPPEKKDIAAGLAPQLVLEALIAAEGGFSATDKQKSVREIGYWKLSGTSEHSNAIMYGEELETWLTETREGLIRLLKTFDNPETPYLSCPDTERSPKYNDYEHLARVKEWRRD